MVIARGKDVVSLDVDKRTGLIDYSYGDYEFNGLRKDGFGYLLSLTNNKGRKVALYINQSASDTNKIDKKIAELQKIPEVNYILFRKR